MEIIAVGGSLGSDPYSCQASCFRFRKTWVSLLIGLVVGGLFQIILAIFAFGFEF